MTNWYERAVGKINKAIDYIRKNPEEARKRYGEQVIITEKGILSQRDGSSSDSIISLPTSIEEIINPKKWVLTGA